MKLSIEIQLGNAAFEDVQEGLQYVLRQVPDKVAQQSSRPPALCDAPEAADKLFDLNGNAVGTVRLTRKEKR